MILSSLNPDVGRLILRLTVGGLMLFHGAAKILNPESLGFISNMLAANNLPSILTYAVFIGEVLAPLMIIVGYQTRIGALLIAINMLFALFLVHTAEFFSLTEHGGLAIELQLFYLFGAIAVVFLGSGRLALKHD